MNKWMIWGENPLFSETPQKSTAGFLPKSITFKVWGAWPGPGFLDPPYDFGIGDHKGSRVAEGPKPTTYPKGPRLTHGKMKVINPQYISPKNEGTVGSHGNHYLEP